MTEEIHINNRSLLALSVMLVMSVNASSVSAAEQRAVAGPGGFTAGYLTPTIAIAKGDSIAFSNLDVFNHDLVHDVSTDGFGGKRNVSWCKRELEDDHDHAGACPVFWSELIGMGEQTQVLGLNRVKPGKTYTFFCTKHHNMKGQLVVTG